MYFYTMLTLKCLLSSLSFHNSIQYSKIYWWLDSNGKNIFLFASLNDWPGALDFTFFSPPKKTRICFNSVGSQIFRWKANYPTVFSGISAFKLKIIGFLYLPTVSQSISLSINLYINLFIHVCIHPFSHPSIQPSIQPYNHSFIHTSTYSSIHPFILIFHRTMICIVFCIVL